MKRDHKLSNIVDSKVLLVQYRDDKELPVEKVGCCSFIWLHWMTKPMIRAYKHGLNSRDLFTMPTQAQVTMRGLLDLGTKRLDYFVLYELLSHILSF